MKVLICASECAPVVKVGGLGDVVGSLPKALKRLNVDVRVVIPAYKQVLEKYASKLEGSRVELPIHYGGNVHRVVVHQITLPNTNIPLYLLENEKYLSSGGIYFDPSAFASSQDEIERFAFFSKAVVETFVVNEENFYPDILHCNDWHTGMIPQLVKAEERYLETLRPACVFTIHNLANQGISDVNVAKRLNEPDLYSSKFIKWDMRDDNLDFILQGILGSDAINTVSPSYAEEIKTPRFGEGLHEVIKAREGRVFGILNGVDYAVFDPSKDKYLKVNYALGDVDEVLSAKGRNKALLKDELGLIKGEKPLSGLVARLTNQKGIDLVLNFLDKILNLGFQVVILGTGDPALESLIRNKSGKAAFRGNFAGIIRFDEGLARRIFASSDVFLIPSRFEPCGLTQMIAMRYGAVPVVRGVGGLKDTVDEARTGFIFDEFNSKDFLAALRRARQAFDDKGTWKRIVKNCIGEDFSWDKSAKGYLDLYKKALSPRL